MSFTCGAQGAYRLPLPVWVVAAVLAVGAAGCDAFTDDDTCSSDCRPTFTCDDRDGECRPRTFASLTTSDRKPPARHLATDTRGDSSVFVAALAPRQNLVVTGPADAGNELTVLARLEDPEQSTVAIDTTDEAVAVAWLDSDRRYRLATRRDGSWEVDRLDTDREYRGSRHMDVVTGTSRERVVFHGDSADNADELLELTRRPDGDWELSTIDEGGGVAGRRRCSSTSGDPSRSGVGYDPDVEVIGGTAFVSYYDANCGDLRLARLADGSWRVDVLDTGDFTLSGAGGRRESGDVGRFSSLTADNDGNLAVAYQDAGRGRLMFAQQTANGFEIELADPGLHTDGSSRRRKQIVGAFADLVFTRGGSELPCIAHMNGSEARTRLTCRVQRSNGSSWRHISLEPPPPSGFYAGIEAPTPTDIAVFAERLLPDGGSMTSNLVEMRLEVRREVQ